MIPQHSFICLYVAQIYDAEEHEKLVRALPALFFGVLAAQKKRAGIWMAAKGLHCW